MAFPIYNDNVIVIFKLEYVTNLVLILDIDLI